MQEYDIAKNDGSATSPVDNSADRSIITTGWMTVTVDDPSDATDETEKIVAAAGGRIDARQEFAAADGKPSSATLTLRIPNAKLADALDALGELGQVESLTQEASDVTVQVQDLDARINALRGSIDRFTALVSTAASLDDLITLETAIADRQAQLESLEAQQRGLSDQVSMSTITATFQAESVAPPRTPGTFLDGLATGWEAFVAFWAALLVALGVLVPWLVTAALILLVVLLIVRAVTRRRLRGPGRFAPQLAGVPGGRVDDSALPDDVSPTTDPDAEDPRS